MTSLDREMDEKERRHQDLVKETVAVGMMFASKAAVQFLANPIVGPLTHKYKIFKKKIEFQITIF